jgi:hypothetical protein
MMACIHVYRKILKWKNGQYGCPLGGIIEDIGVKNRK